MTLRASDTSAAEAGSATGAFTVTRTGPTTAALTVTYTVGGTASAGSDYTALAGSVIIPAGAKSALITVTPVDDALVEAAETVVVTLSPSATYIVGSPNTGTVTIADNDRATVTIRASDASATEAGPTTGAFTVTRTAVSPPVALTVHYAVAGSATSGSDYVALSGSVVIPAGANSATITVTPVDNAVIESAETVVVTLSANAAYIVGSAKTATVTIADNDRPTVTIRASDASATEAGLTTGVFTVTRTAVESAGGPDGPLHGQRLRHPGQRLRRAQRHGRHPRWRQRRGDHRHAHQRCPRRSGGEGHRHPQRQRRLRRRTPKTATVSITSND